MFYKTNIVFRAFAFVMAFWMSFTSLGVAVDMHFCGDELKSINFFGEAEKCNMHQVDGKTSKNRPCCHRAKAKKRQCCHHSKSNKSSSKSCHQHDVKEKNGEGSFKGNRCCHDEQFKFELDEDFVKDDIFSLQLTNDIKFEDCVPVVLSFFSFNKETSNSFSERIPPPPLPETNFLATVQCYRI